MKRGREKKRGEVEVKSSKKKKGKIEEQLHDYAIPPASWLLGVLRLLNFCNHQFKCLDDILVVPCRRLRPRTIPFCCQGLALFSRNLSLDVEIGFVADHYDWNPIGAL